MNQGRRLDKFGFNAYSKPYMDLKDIVRESALHFLSAKSLFKIQFVCRDWKVKISTPFFEHNQSISFPSIGGMFFQRPEEPPMLLPFDSTSCGVPDPSLRFLPGAVVIRSSCNGLLLCQACSWDRAYYVCNPVTQKFKQLPYPTADHGPDPAIVLAFEPSLLNFEAEFKIVSAFQSVDFDYATEFDIYSSRDGSWTTSGAISFASPTLKQGIYANGVIYFTALKHSCILSYDVARGRSSLMNYRGFTGTLGIVNGKLCSAYCSGSTLMLSQMAHSNRMQTSNGCCRMRYYEDSGFTLDREVVGCHVTSPTVLFAGGDVLVIQAGARLISYDLNTKLTVAFSSI